MMNFKARRAGFRFEIVISENGSKKTVAALEIMYIRGSQRKGVLASVKHIEIEDCESYTSETTTMFADGNFTMWVKELPRKSDKAVLQVAEALDSFAPEIVAAFLQSPQAAKDALRAAAEQAVR